jgi:hypothetical protein
MQVEQILTILTSHDKLDRSLAPNILGVTNIDQVTGLHLEQYMSRHVLMVLHHALLPPIEFIWSLLCRLELNRTVNYQALLQNFSPNNSSALWALLLSYKTFCDALMAITMSTDCNTATDDGIHANWTFNR